LVRCERCNPLADGRYECLEIGQVSVEDIAHDADINLSVAVD
jgi:hypothetical protein